MTINFIEEWRNNSSYMFIIVDASINQGVGFAVLNHINRQHQTIKTWDIMSERAVYGGELQQKLQGRLQDMDLRNWVFSVLKF